MFTIEEFKKQSVKIPLFVYFAVILIYEFSAYKGLVYINPIVEKFAFFDISALIFLYVLYWKKKLSYNLFVYFFVFSIFMVLNFTLYYNTHVMYRSMWVIALIPLVFLYAGRKIGIFFAVYFLFFVIFVYLEGLFKGVHLQDLYVFVFSDVLVGSISYFFVLYLEKYTFIVEKEHHSLETKAYTDSLTGIYNRRGFLKAVKKKNGILGVFDLDDFKKINDEYGHKAGDEYLKLFTDILTKNVRKNDIVGRIGGDEFVVLFNDANMTDIKKWVIKFYEELYENSTDELKISVSAGFSEYYGNIRESFIIADKKLYQSKKKKNTFTF